MCPPPQFMYQIPRIFYLKNQNLIRKRFTFQRIIFLLNFYNIQFLHIFAFLGMFSRCRLYSASHVLCYGFGLFVHLWHAFCHHSLRNPLSGALRRGRVFLLDDPRMANGHQTLQRASDQIEYKCGISHQSGEALENKKSGPLTGKIIVIYCH